MRTLKLRPIGNSTGTTFPTEVLTTAGFSRGDELVLTVEEGRIVLSKSESVFSRAMDALDRCTKRYDHTLMRLAK